MICNQSGDVEGGLKRVAALVPEIKLTCAAEDASGKYPLIYTTNDQPARGVLNREQAVSQQ